MPRYHLDQKKKEKWMTFVHSLNPDVDPRAFRLMEEMRMVSHALYQTGEGSLARSRLSYARFRLLMTLLFHEEIEGRDSLHPSEISQKQGISRNTVSALIRDLEEEGLVERHLDQSDRRKFNIRLTDAGRARVRDHASRHLRIIASCFGTLTPDEQDILGRLLTKVSQNIGAAKDCLPKTSPP